MAYMRDTRERTRHGLYTIEFWKVSETYDEDDWKVIQVKVETTDLYVNSIGGVMVTDPGRIQWVAHNRKGVDLGAIWAGRMFSCSNTRGNTLYSLPEIIRFLGRQDELRDGIELLSTVNDVGDCFYGSPLSRAHAYAPERPVDMKQPLTSLTPLTL